MPAVKICESLVHHQEMSTLGRQVQSVRKTKIKDIKVTAYWFFKYFVGLFQIRQLWQWAEMEMCMEQVSIFYLDFDVSIVLVTILFHIHFEFLNY